MGITRPFLCPTRPLEAKDPLALDLAQLYVMPVAQEQPENQNAILRAKGGNLGELIVMPSRWSIAAPIRRPQRLYRGNAVECWPRGYPAHDDL